MNSILPFSDQSYSRPGFRVPTAKLLNMYVEATPAGPGKDARYPRPTLATSYTLGSGPIRGLFHSAGVLGGEKYAVSGGNFYQDTTLIGSVFAGGRAQFAGSTDQLVFTIGGGLYVYDGISLWKIRWFKELATSVLTLTANASAGETVTLGAKTYTFRVAVSVANDVKIGATAADTIVNLVAAIVAGTGSGTLYGTGTTANADATAAATSATTMKATAKAYNSFNPNVAATDTMANGSWSLNPLNGMTPLPNITSVVLSGGRFFYTVEDTDTYYWSDVGDARYIDGLAFATAESSPDHNVQVATLSDEVWFFGSETVEPWYQTGQADAPLQRSQGRKFEKGCAAQGTVVATDNTLFFVGNDHLVYRSGNVPLRVSTHSIEAAIERCSDIASAVAYPIWFGGHSFYILNLPGVGTFAYDISTGKWSEWTSYGLTNFIPNSSMIIDDTVYLGSSLDGTVYTFAQGNETDDGETVTFMASCYLPVATGNLINFSLMLQGTRGLGVASGLSRPVVEMHYSDDAGQTWSSWKRASLGFQGAYSFKAIWRCLGQVNSPGRIYEFRTTDAVPIVYEFVTYNQGTP